MTARPDDPDGAHADPDGAHAEAARLRLMADNVPVLIAYYERHGFTCRYANRNYAGTFGFTPETILGRTFGEIIGEAAQRQIQPLVDAMLENGKTTSYERVMAQPDGSRRHIHVDLLPHAEPSGSLLGAFVLIQDITPYREAEAALRESEVRMAKFMEASVEGIVFHAGGIITDINAPIETLTGLRRDEVVGRHVMTFIPPEHRERVAQVMSREEELSYELEILGRDEVRIPVEFIVRTMVHGNERLRMTIVRDIRDRRAAQARIHHLAHHDPLTGLANRRSFMGRLEKLLASRTEGSGAVALLFIDLDHFKRINDSLGHLAGDSLLQQVAQRITGHLRASDLVGRFGGDEFVVLLPAVSDRRQVHDVASKLLTAVAAPLDLGGTMVSVTPSIGIAICPRDGQTPAELLRNADAAMYAAKSAGRAGMRFFEPAMRLHSAGSMALDAQLQQALREGEFALLWQPLQVLGPAGATGAAVRCRALPRWRHPERGWLAPADVIDPALPGRGAIALAEWALGETAAAAARLGLARAEVALDLVGLRLTPAALSDALSGLAEQPLDGLTLEAGAALLGAPPRAFTPLLARLQAQGVALAAADAPQLAVPLARLAALPLRYLGCHTAAGDAATEPTVQALLAMGRPVAVPVQAEPVAEAALAAWLRQAQATSSAP